MILGIGSDIVNMERIQKVLETYGDRFLHRIYTPHEQQRADVKDKGARVGILAKRFAAKEAMLKALGTGFKDGVTFKQIGVRNLANGRPVIELTGAAKDHLNTLTPRGMDAKIELTLSDDAPMAQAFVIISAQPRKA